MERVEPIPIKFRLCAVDVFSSNAPLRWPNRHLNTVNQSNSRNQYIRVNHFLIIAVTQRATASTCQYRRLYASKWTYFSHLVIVTAILYHPHCPHCLSHAMRLPPFFSFHSNFATRIECSVCVCVYVCLYDAIRLPFSH